MNNSASVSHMQREKCVGKSPGEPAVTGSSSRLVRFQTSLNCKAIVLARCTAPALWRQIDLVSGLVGTRAPELTLIVHGSEVSIFGRAAALGRATSRGLVLGHQALERLTITELHAVLAHEFAHFAQEESFKGRALNALQTALNGCSNLLGRWGPVSRPLRQALVGQARLSRSVAHHRELEADRLAARLFGAVAMRRALEGLAQCYVEAQPCDDAEAINIADNTSLAVSRMVYELHLRTHPAVRHRVNLLNKCIDAGPPALAEDHRAASRLVPANVIQFMKVTHVAELRPREAVPL